MSQDKPLNCFWDKDCEEGLECVKKRCREKPDIEIECISDNECSDDPKCNYAFGDGVFGICKPRQPAVTDVSAFLYYPCLSNTTNFKLWY